MPRRSWPAGGAAHNLHLRRPHELMRPHSSALGLVFFGRLLRRGLKTNTIVFSSLLKCLCHAKRTDEAVSVLLHRMSELGCVPDAFSYTIVLKSLCDGSSSQRALDLLQMMEKGEGVCSPLAWCYIPRSSTASLRKGK
nr:restorer of fertility-like protein [Triticum aestivum]QIP66478.1 restorer of fertility-like protein [Triticum aestivum]QIP66686.1 restorer of fertility-like protein [Triticum aestivum]